VSAVVRRSLAWIAVAWLVAAPGAAATRSFEAAVALAISPEETLALGTASGSASEDADGTVHLPAVPLLPPDEDGPLSCAAPDFEATAFAGGRLTRAGSAVMGPVGIPGRVWLDLAGAGLPVDALSAAAALGQRASAFASTVAPDATPPRAQAALEISFSRWALSARITGTSSLAPTPGRELSGSLVSLASGVQQITLVSPVHVRVSELDAGGAASFRTFPMAGELAITLDDPPVLAGQAAGAAVLWWLGRRARRRRSRRAATNA